MNYLNKFLKIHNLQEKEKLWHIIDYKKKQVIIIHMFNNKTDKYIKLAQNLLQFIRKDDKLNRRDIHTGYANLLCILLAKSHDLKYIDDIIKTKCCGDLFFYIDSTLQFEFSPQQNRENCIIDTIQYVNNNICNNVYKKWVLHYGKMYDETLVINYWNKYKDPTFYKELQKF